MNAKEAARKIKDECVSAELLPVDGSVRLPNYDTEYRMADATLIVQQAIDDAVAPLADIHSAAVMNINRMWREKLDGLQSRQTAEVEELRETILDKDTMIYELQQEAKRLKNERVMIQSALRSMGEIIRRDMAEVLKLVDGLQSALEQAEKPAENTLDAHGKEGKT